MDDEA